MIFAMSDFHGHFSLMKYRIEQMKSYLEKDDAKLLLLGDFIDRGKGSYECLKLAFDLEKEFGSDKVISLKGNHEVWFENFLFCDDDIWLSEDRNYRTSRTFLTEKQLCDIYGKNNREDSIDYLRDCVKENHPELLHWMRTLRLFYETDTQIFVHAGVYEDIPYEGRDYITIGTPDYFFTDKYPPTKGRFYKDIIAGHVGVGTVAHNKAFKKIYYDGESHYYIDGSVGKNRQLLCLAYDETLRKYYSFTDEGVFEEVIAAGK